MPRPKPASPLVQYTLRLPEDVIARLTQDATEQGLALSVLLRNRLSTLLEDKPNVWNQ
ncbi:hypothetical protein [Nostoc sp.]|uniref:hypothetical protein n=1 Tax=Nostoc sp. TaxID=1180 RepID=UPI002FF81963